MLYFFIGLLILTLNEYADIISGDTFVIGIVMLMCTAMIREALD